MVKRAFLAVSLAAAVISLAYSGARAQTEPLSVPAGTVLHCRTTETLTTRLNSQGDAFAMNVAEPVTDNGQVTIPAGSTLAGRITSMERPGRIKGVGQMRLTLEQITLPDGRSFPLGATLMTAYGPREITVVGSEGLVKGPSSRLPNFEEMGGGTAGGALLGLIFGHPIIGATVGLTAATVDRMRRGGKDLTIPVGTQLNFQLTRELAITHNASPASAANLVHVAGE